VRYIIFTDEDGEKVIRSSPLSPTSEAYLRDVALPALRPLSDEAYVDGPAEIVGTLARSSYVLDDEVVYWCVEWPPGLLVVRLSPDGSMASAELTSPNPEFGGREATPEELDDFYDVQDEDNPQYDLVFDAWDAQFDEEEWTEWEVAAAETADRFAAATAHADRLAQQAEYLRTCQPPPDESAGRLHGARDRAGGHLFVGWRGSPHECR
jgi:hypothetical protein